jgi:hypothetical protein
MFVVARIAARSRNRKWAPSRSEPASRILDYRKKIGERMVVEGPVFDWIIRQSRRFAPGFVIEGEATWPPISSRW